MIFFDLSKIGLQNGFKLKKITVNRALTRIFISKWINRED